MTPSGFGLGRGASQPWGPGGARRCRCRPTRCQPLRSGPEYIGAHSSELDHVPPMCWSPQFAACRERPARPWLLTPWGAPKRSSNGTRVKWLSLSLSRSPSSASLVKDAGITKHCPTLRALKGPHASGARGPVGGLRKRLRCARHAPVGIEEGEQKRELASRPEWAASGGWAQSLLLRSRPTGPQGVAAHRRV